MELLHSVGELLIPDNEATSAPTYCYFNRRKAFCSHLGSSYLDGNTRAEEIVESQSIPTRRSA
jgi:hypothetical protein